MRLFSRLIRCHSLFNVSREYVSEFTVEPGEKIEKGDFVVINTTTLLARKPIKRSGYLAVGVANKVIDRADGKQSVICVDGHHILYNPKGDISESDIGKPCYFLDKDTVTLESTDKTKAGIIAGIEISNEQMDIEDGADRIIWVKTDIVEGSELDGNK